MEIWPFFTILKRSTTKMRQQIYESDSAPCRQYLEEDKFAFSILFTEMLNFGSPKTALNWLFLDPLLVSKTIKIQVTHPDKYNAGNLQIKDSLIACIQL